jgi:hypothetical protein
VQRLSRDIGLTTKCQWPQADSGNEMVIDLEDGTHFALHLLTGPRNPARCTKGLSSNPDDTVPQRGSRTFEASAHSQCRPHLASRLNKIVILEVTGVNRLYGLLTRGDGYLNGLMTRPHTCPFRRAALSADGMTKR